MSATLTLTMPVPNGRPHKALTAVVSGWSRAFKASTLPPVSAAVPLEKLIEPALRREPAAARALVVGITPFIQKRVYAALSRRASRGRVAHQEVLDMTQDILLSLFEKDGHVLRSWDKDRGRSLTSFVSLVAERQVASIMRSGKRSPWTEDPTEAQHLDRADPAPSAEGRVASADQLRALLDRLRAECSPLGFQMFEALYVAQRDVNEVAQAFSMKPDAIYAWRSRLRRQVAKISSQMAAEVQP